jgi:hypothetical protein
MMAMAGDVSADSMARPPSATTKASSPHQAVTRAKPGLSFNGLMLVMIFG